jgi:hypothetical protein
MVIVEVSTVFVRVPCVKVMKVVDSAAADDVAGVEWAWTVTVSVSVEHEEVGVGIERVSKLVIPP